MPQAEYERRLLTRSFGTHRWEEQAASDYAFEDLDLGALDWLLNAAVACGRLERRPASHEEALDKLRLRIEGRLVQAAVVLLAREVMPHYPQGTIRMARFQGISKLGDFLDQRQLYGHAFHLLDEAEVFLRRHIPVAGHFEPDNWIRQDRPAYPFLALREALVNAICHRDYSIVGGAIYVAIYDDRMEITSAGVLPPGITVEDLKRVHMSVPRNSTIADAFFRAGLIERWGRGTLKIIDLCRVAGQSEPEFEVQAGHVVVRFLPGEYVPPTQVQHTRNCPNSWRSIAARASRMVGMSRPSRNRTADRRAYFGSSSIDSQRRTMSSAARPVVFEPEKMSTSSLTRLAFDPSVVIQSLHDPDHYARATTSH